MEGSVPDNFVQDCTVHVAITFDMYCTVIKGRLEGPSQISLGLLTLKDLKVLTKQDMKMQFIAVLFNFVGTLTFSLL